MVQAVPRLPSEFQRAVGILVNDVNSGHRGVVTAIVLVLGRRRLCARNGCSGGCSIARRRPTELQAERNMRLLTEPIPLLVFAAGERRAVPDVLLAAAVAPLRAHLAVRLHRLPRRADDCRHAAQAGRSGGPADAADRSRRCRRAASGSCACSCLPVCSCSAGRWSA